MNMIYKDFTTVREVNSRLVRLANNAAACRPKYRPCCHRCPQAGAVGPSVMYLWRGCRRTPSNNRPCTTFATPLHTGKKSETHNLPNGTQACARFVRREFGKRKEAEPWHALGTCVAVASRTVMMKRLTVLEMRWEKGVGVVVAVEPSLAWRGEGVGQPSLSAGVEARHKEPV